MRALGLGLLSVLGACGPTADPSICTTPPMMNVEQQLPPDVRAEGCVHRWSYRLAKTKDPTPAVAEPWSRDVVMLSLSRSRPTWKRERSDSFRPTRRRTRASLKAGWSSTIGRRASLSCKPGPRTVASPRERRGGTASALVRIS